MANTNKGTTKKATVKDQTSATEKSSIDSKDLQNLYELINSLKDKVSSLEQDLSSKTQEVTELKEVRSNTLDDDVTIIDNLPNGVIDTKLSNWRLTLTKFGQKMTITKREFQELVNSRRTYFDKKYILLDAKYLDLAMENGVSAIDPNSSDYISAQDLKAIGDMDAFEVTALYNKLSDSMKKIFLGFYMNRCYEEDPKFYRVDTMNALNQASKGHIFDNLISKCANNDTENS